MSSLEYDIYNEEVKLKLSAMEPALKSLAISVRDGGQKLSPFQSEEVSNAIAALFLGEESSEEFTQAYRKCAMYIKTMLATRGQSREVTQAVCKFASVTGNVIIKPNVFGEGTAKILTLTKCYEILSLVENTIPHLALLCNAISDEERKNKIWDQFIYPILVMAENARCKYESMSGESGHYVTLATEVLVAATKAEILASNEVIDYMTKLVEILECESNIYNRTALASAIGGSKLFLKREYWCLLDNKQHHGFCEKTERIIDKVPENPDLG